MMTEMGEATPASDPDPLAEIEAMRQVATALSGLEPASRARVLDWAVRFFRSGTSVSVSSRGIPVSPAHESIEQEELTGGVDLASFFARARPSTEAEKALVVGYWLQVRQGAEEFDGYRVNSELAHLGHRVANITQALGGLMRTKPQQVVQTRKQGKTKQARKRYKVTVEGMRKVEQMLRTETE